MITTHALPAASGKGRRITLWILSGLVALAFIGAGGAMLGGAAAMVELFAKVGFGSGSGISPAFWKWRPASAC
jgi:hypothetical protein